MAIRISELNALSADLSQSDELPIVDVSAAETKKITVANIIGFGISGSPSSFIDLAKLNQNSSTKLSASALDSTGVASGVYGDADTVARFVVNQQGLITSASGVPIVISATNVTDLAPVATTGNYASLSGLPTLGSLASQNAGSIVVSGGSLSGVTLISNNAIITGGSIDGITDLAIADGGTGASTASEARTNLGLEIGSDIQAYSPILSGVSEQFSTPDVFIYASASGVVESASISSLGRLIVSGETASGVRSTLGLGTVAVQNADSIAITGGSISGVALTADNVTISGGTIVGIVDLAVADGGTGASTASGARTNLGLSIGSDVQAYSSNLDQAVLVFDQENSFAYTSSSGVVNAGAVGSIGLAVLSGSTASGVRSTIGLGSIATQDEDSINISGGSISGVTLNANDVTISGGTITAITDLAVVDGGTGASTAIDARANLGLVIGSDVQEYSQVLSGVATSFTAADEIIYASASGVVSSTAFTSFARSIVSGTTASGVRETLELGSIALQDSDEVTITGGSISGVTFSSSGVDISGGVISGITDLAIEDGGTGASSAEDARTNLGLAIGLDVQAYSPVLSGVAESFTNGDEIIYASASGVISTTAFTSFARSVVSGASASEVRSTLGIGSIAIQNADSVVISGGVISGVSFISSGVDISGGIITGITDLDIADGGTGASTAENARINLGLAIGSDVQAYSPVLSGVAEGFDDEDQIIYSMGSGVVATASFTALGRSIVSGVTASGVRSTLELGSIALQNADNIVISGGTITGVSLASDNVNISGGAISGITDLAIADGGTGASTAADARINLGLAIGSDVQPYSPVLSGVSEGFDNGDEIIYASASGVVSTTPFTSFARSIASGTSAEEVRNTLELGSVALQESDSVDISGGAISGVTLNVSNATISGGTIVAITDLAVEDGGTGASTAEQARANLGLVIGSGVQAYSNVLDGIAGAYNSTDNIAYASASGVIATTSLTSFGRTLVSQTTASGARGELGLGSIALQNSDSVAITGGTVSGITDLAIADGGTGASTAADARTNLGLAIGSDVQAYDPALSSIAGLTTAADQFIYTTAADTYAASPIVSFARDLLASGSSANDVRDLLGLGGLATQSLVGSGAIDNGVIVGAMVASGGLIASNYGNESIVTAAISGSAVTSAKIATKAVTGEKLGDSSSTIVAIGAPGSAGSFIGQQYIDSATDFAYFWDGSVWMRHAALSSVEFADSSPLAFVVSYPDNNTAIVTTTVDTQASNTIWAGPASGTDAAPAFRGLVPGDLPIATDSTIGAVRPGAGLSVEGDGTIAHTNVSQAGTYTGAITIDAQGHIVSAQASLQASDIPNLDASKITTGTFSSSFLADNSVTAAQLADYGIAQVSESAPVPEFAGQWWINPNDRSAYIWVGDVSPAPNGYWLNLGYGSPTQINLRFGGTYNASGNTVESINSYGIEAGLTVGQGLSAPNTSNNGIYLIVTASGVGSAPAPAEALTVGNWVLSQGVGASWTKVDLTSAVAGVADQDVLVAGALLNPAASGVATQQDFNESVWPKVQVATSGTTGIVRGSAEIIVASGTGIMSVGVIDEESY